MHQLPFDSSNAVLPPQNMTKEVPSQQRDIDMDMDIEKATLLDIFEAKRKKQESNTINIGRSFSVEKCTYSPVEETI